MIYLDNNATTPVAPEVFAAMEPYLTAAFGNPSSSHHAGREAHRAVEDARASTANLLGATEKEIVFTSGGPEGDNWAIRGALAAREVGEIVTTRVEHEAVRKLCEELERAGTTVHWIDVDSNGLPEIDQISDALNERTVVVSVMMANN